MTRGRTTTRPVADAQRQIAIGQLQRQGYLHPGETRFMFWWHQGQVTARLGIHAHSDGDRLTLYTGHLQGQQTDVSLYYSYPHLGGRRAWFRCPHCARRVGVLYWRSVIACRTCHRLRYRVEAETDGDKAFRRADKLRARLGWVPGVAHGEGSRPKGMHHRTFNALVNKYRAAELQALGAMEHCIDRMNGKLGRIYTIQSARRW